MRRRKDSGTFGRGGSLWMLINDMTIFKEAPHGRRKEREENGEEIPSGT